MGTAISQEQAMHILNQAVAMLPAQGDWTPLVKRPEVERIARLLKTHNWVFVATIWTQVMRLESRQQAGDSQVALLTQQQGPSLPAAELQKITELQTALGSLQTSVAASERQLRQLGQTTQTVQGTVTSLQAAQLQQQAELSRALSGLESANELLGEIAGQVNTHATRAELTTTAGSLQGNVDALSSQLSQLQLAFDADRRPAPESAITLDSLAAVEQRLAAVEGRLGAHDIAQLQAKSDVFSAMFADIYEQVHRMAAAAHAQAPLLADRADGHLAAEQEGDGRQEEQALLGIDGAE